MATDRVVPKSAGEKFEGKKIPPSSPIGVFDSGVGGLTVLRELMHQLPHEETIYLADSARVPYGGRPPEEIIKINQQIIPFLIDRGAKLVVIACGTSSSIAYSVIKDDYKVKLVGLIEPGARAAAAATKSGNIGLIATLGTINSGAYQSALSSFKVFGQACPLFVPLVEGGFTETEETKKVAKEYLKPLLKEKIDTLILGCTHYPHLSKILREIVGPGVKLIDPAEETTAEVKRLLKQAGTLSPKTAPAKHSYLVTGPVGQFETIGSRLLGHPITHAKHVII